MTSPARGFLRFVRGGVLAAACTLCALGGHALAGGAIPGLGSLVVLGWLGACFVLLADRRRGFGGILTAAGGSQVVFHVMFALTGAHAAHTPTQPAVVPDVGMLAGHATAAVCVAALLAHGESVAWGLYHAFRLVSVPTITLPIPGPRAASTCVAREPGSAREALFVRAHPLRGPPVSVA